MLPRLTLLLLLLFPSARTGWAFVELKPQTRDAFDRYVRLSEERMEKDSQAGRHLLEGRSSRQEIQTHPLRTLEQGKELDIPEGQVQHWFGAMFIPRATLAQVREVMQDYANYKNRYKPDVIESKLLSQKGGQFEVFLRLYQKHILTVVLNATYNIRYTDVGGERMSIRSVATRIAEVENPGRSNARERVPGKDNGFLWRLNSYWRFEEADGGVYAECEAISLSRDAPALVRSVVNFFVKDFPRDSMLSTLSLTRQAVLDRRQTSGSLSQ